MSPITDVVVALGRVFGFTGSSQGRGAHPVPGEEEVFRGVQVPQVQEEVDEREFLGQYGTRMYQVPPQRVPAQAGDPRQNYSFF